MIALII